MKGTWKENISSWNHKDTKRKKQSRKHTIKDNGKYLIKNQPSNSYRDEIIFVEENIVAPKKGTHISVYEVIVDFRYGKPINAYFKESVYSKKWYSIDTNKLLNKDIIVIKEKYKKYIHYNETNKPRQKHLHKPFNLNSYVYLYNKYLESYLIDTFWDDGKRRKQAQKMVNSMDRSNIRSWLSKRDWDKEIKTHSLSKSIAWEVS